MLCNSILKDLRILNRIKKFLNTFELGNVIFIISETLGVELLIECICLFYLIKMYFMRIKFVNIVL